MAASVAVFDTAQAGRRREARGDLAGRYSIYFHGVLAPNATLRSAMVAHSVQDESAPLPDLAQASLRDRHWALPTLRPSARSMRKSTSTAATYPPGSGTLRAIQRSCIMAIATRSFRSPASRGSAQRTCSNDSHQPAGSTCLLQTRSSPTTMRHLPRSRSIGASLHRGRHRVSRASGHRPRSANESGAAGDRSRQYALLIHQESP
jgi:hypothetical protein